jgi:ABC-type phosphate transport system substrate-binding protein
MLRRISLLLVALCAGPAVATVSAQAAVVVVNAANPATAITKDQLGKAFMKKLAKWDNGAAVAPVDQAGGTPVREAFYKEVVGKSSSTMKVYWQQMTLTGSAAPPAEKPGNAEVLAFVRDNPGAIGYVAPGTPLGAGVKAVPVQ